MLLTPEGKPARGIDRIMLLAMWARKLNEDNSLHRPIITAGLGKPTFPINEYVAKSAANYWNNLWSKAQEARHLLQGNYLGIKKTSDEVVKIGAVVGYGDLKGDKEARIKMAEALARWYQVSITADDILFTVGGAGALHVIFEMLNRRVPNGRIITPFPHYSLYSGIEGKNNLHPIHVLKEKGYRLTAKAFLSAVEGAYHLGSQDGNSPVAFLFCDPNNPLGTTIEEKELQEIANILRKYPDLLIIMDEAYAEMRLDDSRHCTSLLTLAPDLKDRFILMRSATKALSAAGERMAVVVTFNTQLMTDLTEKNINIYGHAPRSLQHAFAEAMDKLDEIELLNLKRFYKEQITYVRDRLINMKANMPDPFYQVNGTFYIITDLSDLLGLELPIETQQALNKQGKINSDEDIAYYLLFKDGIMIAPLSYFGVPSHHGYMRITCSGGYKELESLMDRLENRLLEARKIKQEQTEKQLHGLLKEIKEVDVNASKIFESQIKNILRPQLSPHDLTAAKFKEINLALKQELSDLNLFANRFIFRRTEMTAIKIQSWWRGEIAKKKAKEERMRVNQHWNIFVSQVINQAKGTSKLVPNTEKAIDKLQSSLLSLSFFERLNIIHHNDNQQKNKTPHKLKIQARL